MDIELTKAVAVVREELIDAAWQGVGQDLGFVVGPIEMEFTVELRVDAKAKMGFKAWVLSAEAEAGVARGGTHRVKLSLTPKRRDGADLLIAATAPDTAGPDTAGPDATGPDTARPDATGPDTARPGDVSGHLGR